MKTCQGQVGRIFLMRLEDGDLIPECIELFAKEKGVSAGYVILLGGIGGGEIIAGPRRSGVTSPNPIVVPVDGGHEVLGVGVLAPDKEGKPILHIHTALGRAGHTITGDSRLGITTRLVGEVILHEIAFTDVVRTKDEKSGRTLLEIRADRN